MTLPGEPCKAPAAICGYAHTAHSHCGCGWVIAVGAGYCRLCIAELVRGASMRATPLDANQPLVAVVGTRTRWERAPVQGLEVLPLPEGHTSWQTTDYCRYGHTMTPENTYWIKGRNDRTWRCCRECRHVSSKVGYRRREARAKQGRSGEHRSCLFCGIAFVSKRAGHVYCSRSHRIAHRSQTNLEEAA